MNEEGLLVPKKTVIKDTKSGFPPAFWSREWDELNQVDALAYAKNNEEIKEQLSAISFDEDSKSYVEIAFKEKAKSKSSQPDYLWKETDLEIVEMPSDTKVTVVGTKSDFSKLKKVLNEASYSIAKYGGKGVTNRTKDTYRELYALAGVNDLSNDYRKRVDDYINKTINSIKPPTDIECIIELRPDIKSAEEYETIHAEISKSIEGTVSKRNIELFFSNMSYVGMLRSYDIKSLLSSKLFSYIRVIKKKPSFSEQRSPKNISTTSKNKLPPLTNVVCGVVDSGIDSDLINGLVTHTFKATKLKEDKTHGTFVASRVLFGHDLALLAKGTIDQLEPIARVLDVQVMGEKSIGGKKRLWVNDEQDLIGAIKKMVTRHREVRIYNISIGEDYAADPKNISETTVALDKLSHEYDVLFVLSAGNHQAHRIEAYDRIFDPRSGHDIGVCAPGDSISSITVGAVAYDVGPDTMTAKKYFPSPFTRIGSIRNDIMKPELVEEGGNYISDVRLDDDVRDMRSIEKYGVVGLSDHTLIRNYGTSFSTPLVTHQAILLEDYITNGLSDTVSVKGNYSNLIRALLAHSTCFVKQAEVDPKSTGLAHGFGLPNMDTLFSSDNNRVTMVYCDQIDLADKVHTLRFELPEFLKSKKSNYVLTLAYNPPVDKNYSKYNMVSLKPSIRSILPEYIDKRTGEVKEDNKTISHGKKWRNARNDRGTLWQYSSVSKNGLVSNVIEIYLQMNVEKALEKKKEGLTRKQKENEKQPYAIVLSVIDGSSSGRLRDEVLASNQFEVVNRTKVQVSV
jgi:hypothetical protein